VKPWHRNSLLLLLLCAIPVITAAQEGKYVGRPVADVLRELQSDRLRIIFSSDLVPLSLSVKAEPKGRNPRDLAQQILASHGLTLQKGPGDTWIVVARPATEPQPPGAQRPAPAQPKQPPKDPAQPPSPGPMRIDERVEVTDRLRETGGSPTAYALEPSAVRDAAGGFENVFQVLQVLPGAAGINDEDGKIAVRGGGPEHNLIVVDGIQIHRPQRLGDFMGSFVNPATIKSVGLDASGLEARYGGRLSSVTTIDTRDGATDRALALSGALGLTSGDALLEGRLPGTESGSWWVTARGTYYRLLLDRLNKEVKPGFEDLQFKVTVRPSPKTRLTFFGLAGRETMEQFASEEGPAGSADFEIARYRGDNGLGVMTLAWTPNASTLATTTLSGYAHRESDRERMYAFGVPPFERATDERDFGARQRFVYAISPRHVIDAGLEVHRIGTGWRMQSVHQPEFWRGLGPSTWGEQIDYAAGPIDTTLRRR
jgi:TonB-dependent Receptor Plug Domain